MYARATKRPIEADGFMRIATNDEIPVTLDGKNDVYGEEDLGGYLVIHEQDLALLIKNTQELLKLKEGDSD